MIISAFECKCGMYNEKLTSNLLPTQLGKDYKERGAHFKIAKVTRLCKICNKSKLVGVIGA